jgi:Zn-dependent M28 family amino/carboxypeptidase
MRSVQVAAIACLLVMELARAFAESGIDFDATLVFTAVAGEEQGLLGARAHARRMKAGNVPVQAVFNNDIVGGATGGDGIIDGAARYVPSHRVRLMSRRDRFGRGGDHTAWNLEAGTRARSARTCRRRPRTDDLDPAESVVALRTSER